MDEEDSILLELSFTLLVVIFFFAGGTEVAFLGLLPCGVGFLGICPDSAIFLYLEDFELLLFCPLEEGVDLPLLVGVDNFGVPLSSTLSLFSLLDLDLSLVLSFEVDLVFEFLSVRSF
jgi:hypothetical protein